MIFKHHKIYENKLSDNLKKDNWAKHILVSMESPSKYTPLYSTLSIGLLLYLWTFLFALIYKQAFAYQYVIFPVLLTTAVFFLYFKNNHALNIDDKSYKINNMILILAIGYCFIMWCMDIRHDLTPDKAKYFYLVFFADGNLKPFDNNTYVYALALCYFVMGVIISRSDCSYNFFRGFYSAYKNDEKSTGFGYVLAYYTVITLFITIFSVFGIIAIFSTGGDSFRTLLRNFGYLTFMIIPPFVVAIIRTFAYLTVAKIASLFDK